MQGHFTLDMCIHIQAHSENWKLAKA